MKHILKTTAIGGMSMLYCFALEAMDPNSIRSLSSSSYKVTQLGSHLSCMNIRSMKELKERLVGIDLNSVETLFLSKNPITTLEGFPKFTNLRSLGMTGCQLRSLKGCPKLSALKTLYLEGNQISDLGGIRNLFPVLEGLRLEGNPIAPSDVFKHLQRFICSVSKQIRVSDMNIRSMEELKDRLKDRLVGINLDTLETFNSVETLNLCFVSKQIMVSNMNIGSMKELKDRLVGINLDTLETFNNVETLNLSINPITSLEGCPEFPNLQSLYIIGCKLQSLKGFPKFLKLRSLDMHGCKLQSLKGCPELSALKYLNLGHNRIRDLEELKNLSPDLRELNLEGNPIVCFDIASDVFSRFKHLQRFIYSAPKQIRASYMNIGSMEELEERLVSFDLNIEETLELSGNPITTLEGFPKFPKLWSLDMPNCQLQSLKGCPELPALETLYLSGNLITTLEGFPKFSKLRSLNMHSCKLQSFKGCSELPALKDLYLSGNPITTLEGFPKFLKLRSLDMHNCQLQSLKGCPELSALETLNLGYNPITTLKGKSRSKFPKLRSLNTTGCRALYLNSILF